MSILIYVFPAFFDVLVAQVVFVNGIRLAQMHCADWIVAGIWAGWSLPYLGATLICGKRLTAQNADRILIAACTLAALTCGLFPFIRSILGIYLLTGLCSVSAGLFFPAFQTFMKSVDRHGSKSVAWSTSMYTFAWSTGFAFGPFLAGFLLEAGPQGWRYSYVLSAILAVLTGIGIHRLRHQGRPPAPGSAAPDAPHAAPPPGAPDLAWLGWTSALVAISAIAVLRSLFPAMAGKEPGLTESRQGLVLFFFSMSQALTGLSLRRSRTWMYRPRAIFFFGLAGILGFLGFAFFRDAASLCIAATVCGIYTGSFYFYFVFHSLVHGAHSAKYVSINESVVGITGIVAPLTAGLLTTATGSYTQAYVGCAALLAGMILFQIVVHARNPIRPTPA